MNGTFQHCLAAIVLACTLILPETSHGATQQLDLGRACIEGKGKARIASELLSRRLAERGHSPECQHRVRFLDARNTGAGNDGFAITPAPGDPNTILVTADRPRALIYAAGWLLMHASQQGTQLLITPPKGLVERPVFAVRGVQIGYRPKNNSYDAWTPKMLARRIEDMALLGANRIQFISPRSDDDATGPLEPVPPDEALVAMATAAHRLDLDVALFQPVLGNAVTPLEQNQEVAKFRQIIALMPTLDALYIPSGDPGHAKPGDFLATAQAMAQATRKRFPKAEVLVSTQGYDAADFADYAARLQKRPQWLSGIFVGPQTRETIEEHRELFGRLYPLELYPDTAHAMHAQYPVEQWHPAFALTEGREPVNPRPAATAAIFAQQTPGTRGFIAYSEGVNDDWNVAQWLQLGWNPSASAEDIALSYSRAFIGIDAFAPVPAMLEANWRGDPSENPEIVRTLSAIDALKVPGWVGWRIDLYRYRAVYDALISLRWKAARQRQAEALYTLRQAPAIGASAARADVAAILERADPAETWPLYSRLGTLAGRLWQDARMQTSVIRYGASNWERGANFDRALTPLDDRVFLTAAMAKAMTLPGEAARRAALAKLGDPWGMTDLALYDDLGNPAAEPHLMRGPGFAQDPQLRSTAIDGVADNLPADGWRFAEVTYAESLYDAPLKLHYDGLEHGRSYVLRVTLAGERYARPMQIMANGEILAPYHSRTANPMRMEIPVPPALLAKGTLDLLFSALPGSGGSGRGQQVAEVWLIPQPRGTVH